MPDVEPCRQCGQRHEHTVARGKYHIVSTCETCAGHVKTDRDAYTPGQRTPLLDKPRPCRKSRPPGSPPDWKCDSHGGGAPQVKAKRERDKMEAAVTEIARKLIPDLADRTQITNPLETLLELASEANAFRESLRVMANELDGKIRYAANGASGEQLRAEVATYRQALKDTTDLLVAIARLDIEKMLARVEGRKVDLVLEAMRHGISEAGLNDDQGRAVMTGVGRHLRSVRGSAA